MKLPDAAYRDLPALGRRVSRIGFGCYRVDDRVPEHREALRLALRSGVNLVDTSTNYGDGHSEMLVGQVVAELAAKAEVKREDVVVVTKAGYVQGSNQDEAVRRMRAGRPWTEMTEYSRDCWHCISPDFLEYQAALSLRRLGLPSVDVLLLHNPEYFLMDAEHRGVSRDEARALFYHRIGRAIAKLQELADLGRIGAYGISSNTFVVPHDRADAVDLTRVLTFAGPGFKVIQLPFNPIEIGAVEEHHTNDGDSVLAVAKSAGLTVLVNRPLNAFSARGLVRFGAVEADTADEATLEAERRASLDDYLTRVFGRVPGDTLSRRTVRALAETEGVDVVLLGMRRREYVEDALGAFGLVGQ